MSMVLGKGGSLHKSLQLMCLQQALRAGHEMNGGWMMGGLVSGCVTGNWKLKLGRDDRETGTGLPSVCWLSLAGRRKEKQKEKATQR